MLEAATQERTALAQATFATRFFDERRRRLTTGGAVPGYNLADQRSMAGAFEVKTAWANVAPLKSLFPESGLIAAVSASRN